MQRSRQCMLLLTQRKSSIARHRKPTNEPKDGKVEGGADDDTKAAAASRVGVKVAFGSWKGWRAGTLQVLTFVTVVTIGETLYAVFLTVPTAVKRSARLVHCREYATGSVVSFHGLRDDSLLVIVLVDGVGVTCEFRSVQSFYQNMCWTYRSSRCLCDFRDSDC